MIGLASNWCGSPCLVRPWSNYGSRCCSAPDALLFFCFWFRFWFRFWFGFHVPFWQLASAFRLLAAALCFHSLHLRADP
jgi:hypothetical protein